MQEKQRGPGLQMERDGKVLAVQRCSLVLENLS